MTIIHNMFMVSFVLMYFNPALNAILNGTDYILRYTCKFIRLHHIKIYIVKGDPVHVQYMSEL